MTWEELEKKHREQWQEFEMGRDFAYGDLLEKHDELRKAFHDSGIELPLSIKTRMREEETAWENNWKPDGEKTIQLKEAQSKEKDTFIKVKNFEVSMNDIKANAEKENREYER